MITADVVDRITRFDSGGLPVVSAYVQIPVDPRERNNLQTRVSSLLAEVRPLTSDGSLDRPARQSLSADLARIEAAVVEDRQAAKAVAFFACSGAGLFEQVGLPRPARERVVVDATPWVRPLLAVLDEFHLCCVVIIDKAAAQVWELFQGELTEARRVMDAMLRKPNYGGWWGLQEHHVRDRADELVKKHYRRVAGLLDEQFRTSRYTALVVGGHPEEVPRFLEYLPRHVRDKLAGTFPVDPAGDVRNAVRENAARLLQKHEHDEEVRWVGEVLGRAAAGGLATVGVPECLWAGSVAAVQTLLLQDAVVQAGVVCDACGWLGTTGDVCAVCGATTRRTPDVLDELAQAVIDAGGTVEHVTAHTELARHAAAAALRFPPPAEPGARASATT